MAREEVRIVVTVKDVLNLGIFEDIWLAAPCEGCEERLVTGAGILDFEPFWGDYDSFTPRRVHLHLARLRPARPRSG